MLCLDDIRRSLHEWFTQPGQDAAVQQHVGTALAELDSAYQILQRELDRTTEALTAPN
jgi:hypothetical protein